ncbi:hypothetical protein Poly51_09930 [Rubripirellula tenax]|uniref:Uncharacterized protein n=1 Tax=Rubripirellula tenax TaxID=2528015 RepID=A0A5C6FMI3_9BACT|nr:hypothetical protein [Rubripirellula tenax]TWU60712.1 hypothetical protein Poly51_09930 [Rubripirellula tenax]
MIHRICQRIRRIALAALVAGSTVAATAGDVARADQFSDSGYKVPVPGMMHTDRSNHSLDDDEAASIGQPSVCCPVELSGTEELCGWVEAPAGDFATHDSCPVPRQADPVTETSGLTVAALATTAVAATGIQVQQFVEPFAMVGPYVEGSLASVEKLQAWFSDFVSDAQSQSLADAVAAKGLARKKCPTPFAGNRPFGCFAQKGSDTSFPLIPKSPAIEIQPIDPLIGGSVFVATIEEDYFAYDWSKRDLKRWSMFSAATSRSFCLRNDKALTVDSMLEQAFADELMDSCFASTASSIQSSPDCLIDQVAGNFQSAVRSFEVASLESPAAIGRVLASMFKSTGTVAKAAIETVAKWMPPTDDQPSDAGAKLLARAELDDAVPAIATRPVIQGATNLVR